MRQVPEPRATGQDDAADVRHLLATARAAHADAGHKPFARDTGTSAAVLVAYGHEFVQGLQGLELGFGVGVGYAFAPLRLYLGGNFVAYLGAAERARSSSYHYENVHSEYAFTAEAGYDFALARHWALRPLCIGGFFVDNADTRIGSAFVSSHDIFGFLGPALVFAYRFDRYSAGVDLRLPIFPSAFLSRLMLAGNVSFGVFF